MAFVVVNQTYILIIECIPKGMEVKVKGLSMFCCRMHEDSGIDYEDMIFFDDEHRNIVEVGKMGR